MINVFVLRCRVSDLNRHCIIFLKIILFYIPFLLFELSISATETPEFRTLKVLDDLFLYGSEKDRDTKITDISSENIKSLAGIEYTYCSSKSEELINPMHCQLRSITYWRDMFEKVNYNLESFITSFKVMKNLCETVLSPKDRADLLDGKADTVVQKFQAAGKEYGEDFFNMLNTLFIFPDRFKEIHSPNISEENSQRWNFVLNNIFGPFTNVPLLNMFLVEKYYQAKQPTIFKKLSESADITLNVDGFTSLEVQTIQRLAKIQKCILDLCKKIEEQKHSILKKRLEEVTKKEDHCLPVKWLESSIKYELLKKTFKEKSFPAIKCFLFALKLPLFALKLPLAVFSIPNFFTIKWTPDPEGRYEPLDMMGQTFAYPSGSPEIKLPCYIDSPKGSSVAQKMKLVYQLLQQLGSFDFQQYQQQKKILDKRPIHSLENGEDVIFNIFQVEKLVKQASWFSWFQASNDDENTFREKIKKRLAYMERICIEEKIIWPEYEDSYTFHLNIIEHTLRFAGMFSLCFLLFSRLIKNNGETLLQNS